MKKILMMMGVGLALLSPQAHADTDSLIEGAKLCTAYLPHYEREYGIPTHLLSAIATTESGRYHEGLKIRIPWPWTINANGKGYIFGSKSQAIAAVRKLRAHGVQSIDVGCMQVNIYHHPDAFHSLDQAFDPETNIAYAAGFLKNLYDEQGSWKKAAADYHSRTPYLGRKYVHEVYDSWYQIIEKLRAARLQVPESSVVAMNELKGSVHKAVVKTTAKPHQAAVKVATYHPTHVREIKVSKQDNTPRTDVIVVKPEIKVAENTPIMAAAAASAPSLTVPQITVAPAQQVPLTLEQTPEKPEATTLSVGDQPVIKTSIVTGHRDGPNFIFND